VEKENIFFPPMAARVPMERRLQQVRAQKRKGDSSTGEKRVQQEWKPIRKKEKTSARQGEFDKLANSMEWR